MFIQTIASIPVLILDFLNLVIAVIVCYVYNNNNQLHFI